MDPRHDQGRQRPGYPNQPIDADVRANQEAAAVRRRRRPRPDFRNVGFKATPAFEVAILEMMEVRKLPSFAHTVRHMISVAKGLLDMEKQGFTEVHVRNPKTGETRQVQMVRAE